MHPCELAPQRSAFILLVAVVLGFLPELQAGEFSTGEKQTQFLTERGLSSKLPQTVKATAFIVDPNKELPDGQLQFLRVKSSEERNLTEAETKKFLEILENRRTYFPDLGKLCVPSYEVGVTLISRTSQTEVVFCLTCDKVSMYGDVAGIGAEIDRGHNALLEFFRAVFPENAALKKLSVREEVPKLSADTAISHAEIFIPGDPLLKRIKATRTDEVTEDQLEELAAKASDAYHNPKKSKKKSK